MHNITTHNMKRSFIIAVAASCILLTSCVSTYNFCQVYETRPVDDTKISHSDDGTLMFENEQCIIYYNFWSNHGTAGFEFYNKTDEVICIDLTKSFFSRNGVAYDLYRGREWSETWTSSSSTTYVESSSQGNTSSVSYGGILKPQYSYSPYFDMEYASGTYSSTSSGSTSSARSSSSAHTSSITYREQSSVIVPPHKKKYVPTYVIAQKLMQSCDLQRYPGSSSRVTYTQENSPLRFSNYVTYTVGENKTVFTVENGFYVSAVTNYADPEISVYRKREEPCENQKDNPEYMERTKSGDRLYDRFTRGNLCDLASSFFYLYDTKSSKKLYKKPKEVYEYYPKYDAYTKF